ncbi:hypothetical protein [Psychroserpens sp. NJDZ02]|uniref:hypothetical protein n=1 Tax=Psychroserpens sp. NJDZ02 TaxID=2570561 RepID=UPI0010A7B815|nr:hypothetical protein [Psychroserpens sp. NJDZ02]QCE40048.1 hypothetical protein E9099_00955 [Psychroserpens sp. NJDZ02]
MKKISILITFLSVLGCNTSYQSPPFLLTEEVYTLKNAEKEAPFPHPNTNYSSEDNEYFLYNYPESVSDNPKQWTIIKDKYAYTVLYYLIFKEENKTYLFRSINKHINQEITNPEQYHTFLKKQGYSDYKVIDTTSTIFSGPYLKMHTILLEYGGIRHQIRFKRKEITVESYLKSQQNYWESKGKFMLDTPKEIIDKWVKENN